jgi:hypothetical protein
MKIIARGLLPEEPDIDLPDHYWVVFGSGRDAISITVIDGEVRVSTDSGEICVLPRAANVVWIRKI